MAAEWPTHSAKLRVNSAAGVSPLGSSPYWSPGASSASGGSEIELDTASSKTVEKSKPWVHSTHTVMMKTPPIKRNALMIWTHVVPFMPPTST